MRHKLADRIADLPFMHLAGRRLTIRFAAVFSAIFIAETGIMLLMHGYDISPLYEALIDSLILVIVLLPVLHILLLTPMLKQVGNELSITAAKLAEAQRIAHLGSWSWDIVADVSTWSDEMYNIYGIDRSEMRLDIKRFYDAVHPDDREMVSKGIDDAVKKGGRYSQDFRILRPDGEVRTVHSQAEVRFDDSGMPLSMVGTNIDITERKRVEEEITRLAHFDQITGLPNRTLFYDRLTQALARAKRHKRKLAVLFLDLDGFKQVNDTFGHHVGDEVLHQVAQRLMKLVREEDTAARIGGDEFSFVINEVAGESSAAVVAGKIIHVLAEPFNIKGKACSIGGSIGISIFPDNSDDMETLITQSDDAMYEAKNNGKNNYRFFSQTTQSPPVTVVH